MWVVLFCNWLVQVVVVVLAPFIDLAASNLLNILYIGTLRVVICNKAVRICKLSLGVVCPFACIY